MLDPNYIKQRRLLVARLARVNRDLALHDLADVKPEVPRPILGRRGLAAVRTRLQEELDSLEDLGIRRNWMGLTSALSQQD